MKIYKLIKEYPDSEKIGTIFEYDPSYKLYKTGRKINSIWTPSYFENGIGEYFEVL